MENKTIKLTVAEIINLNLELTSGENALLAQKLPMTTKYHLTKIGKEISTHLESFDKSRQDLIKSLGTETESGAYEVKPDSENFTKFREQIAEVLGTEEEITFPALTIADFATLETDGFYPVLFKLLEA